jgi:integrase-like protein
MDRAALGLTTIRRKSVSPISAFLRERHRIKGKHAVFLPAARDQTKPKLLDQVRQLMRLRHYSLRTEEAYVGWIRRYILFHGKRHPSELDEKHVSQFLTSLAMDGRTGGRCHPKSGAQPAVVFVQVTGRGLVTRMLPAGLVDRNLRKVYSYET